MDALFQVLGSVGNAATGYQAASSVKPNVTPATSGDEGFSWFWMLMSILFTFFMVWSVYSLLNRAESRPVVSGFYGGAISGSSGLPCGRMSSEAEELYSFFASKSLSVGEEGSSDLHNLRNLLSKMTCMKSDLMSPGQVITAVKELGFATHMDIQPVADITARCFVKGIPERDLDIQFGKWRDYGLDLIRRLCTAANLQEAEVKKAEQLFTTAWKDTYSVAQTQCLSGAPQGMFKVGPHDPAPNTPEELEELRPYDGLY